VLGRRLALAVLAGGALLASPAGAHAATLYVSQGAEPSGNSPGCPEASPCSLENAVTQANATSEPDKIQILGAYTKALPSGEGLPLTAHAIALVGSGREAGGTTLTFEGAPLRLGAGSSVSNAALSTTSFPALEILGGASAETLRISTTYTSGFVVGLFPHGGESALRNAILTLPVGGGASEVGVDTNTSVGGGDALVSDVEVTAPTGIELNGEVGVGKSVVQRAATHGGRCLASNATNIVSDLLCLPASATNDAISVAGELDLRQATVVGVGLHGVETAGSSGTRTAHVHGSIVRGFGTDFVTNSGGTIAIDTSDFHSSVGITAGAGNVDLEPQFLGAGDYRLALGSPLIGLAGTLPIQPDESSTDVGGRPRIVGGSRDMGAFEHQLIQPSITASANPVTVGQPVTFSAAGSSYLESAIASSGT
jgi:hypothetical protein